MRQVQQIAGVMPLDAPSGNYPIVRRASSQCFKLHTIVSLHFNSICWNENPQEIPVIPVFNLLCCCCCWTICIDCVVELCDKLVVMIDMWPGWPGFWSMNACPCPPGPLLWIKTVWPWRDDPCMTVPCPWFWCWPVKRQKRIGHLQMFHLLIYCPLKICQYESDEFSKNSANHTQEILSMKISFYIWILKSKKTNKLFYLTKSCLDVSLDLVVSWQFDLVLGLWPMTGLVDLAGRKNHLVWWRFGNSAEQSSDLGG